MKRSILILLVLAWACLPLGKAGTAQAAAIVLTQSTSWSVCSSGGTAGSAPSIGDTIDLKTYTLTLDGGTASTHTCASISTTSSGYIIIPAGVSTCNTTTLSAGTVTIVTVGSGQTFNASGTIRGGVNAAGITVNNASAVAILGTITGGSGATAGVGCALSAGYVSATNINGGSKSNSYGLNASGGTVAAFNATGNATASSSSGIFLTSGTPKVTVSGTCTGGTNNSCGLYLSSGTPTVTIAKVKGSDASATGYGTYLMTGAITVSSGTAGTAAPALCCSYGTTTIAGNIYPTNNIASVYGSGFIVSSTSVILGFPGTSSCVTFYASALVPSSSNVWTGVTTGGTTGSLTLATSAYLSSKTLHGTAGILTISPSGILSASGGTINVPTAGYVYAGQLTGLASSAGSVGTLTLPSGSNVWSGEPTGKFGVSGSGTTASLVISPSTAVTGGTISVPASDDVWTGVATGGTTGSLFVTPSLMLTSGTVHGTAGTWQPPYIGSLGSGTASQQNAVKWGIQFGEESTLTGNWAGHGPLMSAPKPNPEPLPKNQKPQPQAIPTRRTTIVEE